MQIVSRTSLAALFVITALGCDMNDDDNDGNTTDENPATGDLDGGLGCFDVDAGTGTASDGGLDGGGEQGDVSDAQSGGIMMTANMGEVEQGLLSVALAHRKEVLAFARQMVDEHSATLIRESDLLRRLGVHPVQTQTSQGLRQSSERTVTSLSRDDADGFDLDYIKAQVGVHADVLALLDDRLIPDADDPAWKAELEATRAAVNSHLQKARALRAKLEAAAGDGGTDAGNDDAGTQGDAGAADAGQDASTDGG
jgi:putative membrane protein